MKARITLRKSNPLVEKTRIESRLEGVSTDTKRSLELLGEILDQRFDSLLEITLDLDRRLSTIEGELNKPFLTRLKEFIHAHLHLRMPLWNYPRRSQEDRSTSPSD